MYMHAYTKSCDYHEYRDILLFITFIYKFKGFCMVCGVGKGLSQSSAVVAMTTREGVNELNVPITH